MESKLDWNGKLHFHMQYSFCTLIDYCTTVIENKESTINSKYEKAMKDENDIQNKYFIAEELHNYSNSEFVNITTQSMIVSLFNIVEVFLRKLCNQIKIDKSLPIGIASFNGSIIDKVRSFYSVYKIKNIKNEAYDMFSRIQKLRDCFVHCNGSIKESRDKDYLMQLLKDGEKIDIENDCMVIKYEYCIFLLTKAKDLMDEIYNDAGYDMLSEIK